MRKLVISAAAVAAIAVLAAPVQAKTLFKDSFNKDNGGVAKQRYKGGNKYSVTGTVDLIKSSDCISGLCINLAGAGGNGGTLTSGTYNFDAGQLVTLSFELRGNPDSVSNSFFVDLFSPVSNFVDQTGDFNIGGESVVGTTYNGDDVNFTGTLAGSDPFTRDTISFISIAAGSLSFDFGTTDETKHGPILDNIRLTSVAAPTPEPATWAMMIVGMGLAGASLRRRNRRTSLRYAF